MRNVLAHAGKQGRRVVSAFIATAFAQTTADAAGKQWRHVADQMRAKLPKLAALLDDLEVTVQTVYRDIATLQARRIPIEGARGIGYV